MAYRVVFSPLAQTDLDKIVDYIARDNREAALRVGRALLAAAHTLTDSPRIGIAFGRRNIRYLLYYPYQIFYRVNDDDKIVQILRLWHGARNPRSLRL